MSTTPDDPIPATVPPFVSTRRAAWTAVVVSACLMVLAFPDWSQDYLVWFTLVPLIAAVRGAGGFRGFLLGYACGVLLEGVGFRWILHALTEFTPDLEGGLSFLRYVFFGGWLLYSSLSWGILGWLLGRCRTPRAVHAAILVWVGVEYYFWKLFPWHLGGAFYEREWLRQAADLFGASGLSYLVLLVNVTLYLLLEWRRGRYGLPKVALLASVVLIVGANIYGAVRLDGLRAHLATLPTLRVLVMQPMVGKEIKHAGRAPYEAFFREHFRKTVRFSETEDIDLIVWNEGIDQVHWFNPKPKGDPLEYFRAKDGSTDFDAIQKPIIVGCMSGVVGTDPRRFDRVWNTAAYIIPVDEAKASGWRALLYHKVNRLLFGEKLPFEEYLPQWLLDRIPVGTIEAGTPGGPPFPLKHRSRNAREGTSRFRILTCYEVTLPWYVRTQSDGVEFLVNITEDIWYGRTAHIEQHESVLRMRCIESRVSVVRCTNVGPSGAIDVTGDFPRSQRTAVWQAEDRIVDLKPGALFSLYRSGGYLFPLIALVVGSVCLILSRRMRRSPPPAVAA